MSKSAVKNLTDDSVILRTVFTFIVPYVFLYAFYIQINGEFSPGGGFQAGAIFATALIILDLVTDKNQIKKLFNIDILVCLAALGVFTYGGTGVISFFTGDNYLNYSAIAVDNIKGQHIGIFIIELGVGITVSTVLCLIYSLLRKN